MPIALVALSVGFVFFTQAYHYGADYQRRASEAFNAGIIPAIEYASENSSSIICVTDQTRFAYIYTLFVVKIQPSEYLSSIEWLLPEFHPVDPARSMTMAPRFIPSTAASSINSGARRPDPDE